MNTTVSAIALALSLCCISTASAETVEVEFDNPQKYTDIRHHTGSKKKYQERLFETWTKFISDEASKILPENYQLKIKFTDIDLAGTYMLGGVDTHRVVRDIDYPRLKFTYQLFNGSELIKESEVTLKDMNFLRHNIKARRSVENFYHEKQLLKKWIKKDVKPLVGS